MLRLGRDSHIHSFMLKHSTAMFPGVKRIIKEHHKRLKAGMGKLGEKRGNSGPGMGDFTRLVVEFESEDVRVRSPQVTVTHFGEMNELI